MTKNKGWTGWHVGQTSSVQENAFLLVKNQLEKEWEILWVCFRQVS